MKFFPESWVPDPDKKFSPFDESLINQIIDGVLKYNQKIKFIKKRHDTDIPGGEFSQRLLFVFKKGEEDFYLEFLKISEHNKKNFVYLENMVWDHCDCTGYDDNELNPVLPNEWVEKKTKKLVGIRIQVGNLILAEFVVPSQEENASTYKKFLDHALKKIPSIINLLIDKDS